MFERQSSNSLNMLAENSSLQIFKSYLMSSPLEFSFLPFSLRSLFKTIHSKPTRSRNATKSSRHSKGQFGGRSGLPNYEGDFLSFKIQEEMLIVQKDLQAFDEPKSRSKLINQTSSKTNKQTTYSSQVDSNVLYYLQPALCQQASEMICLNSSSEEGREQLMDCLKQITNELQNFSFFIPDSPPSAQQPQLSKYHNLFCFFKPLKQFSALFKNISLLLNEINPILPPSKQTHLFSLIIEHIRESVNVSDDQQDLTLQELKVLNKYVDLSLTSESEFSNSQFWEKMLFLMKKSPKYHNIIEISLKQHQHDQLAIYFRSVVDGKQGSFDGLVFDSQNKHCQQFLLLLQRKWIYWFNDSRQPLSDSAIAAALKQIQLKAKFGQNYDHQKCLLQLYAEQTACKLKNQLARSEAEQSIRGTVRTLLSLGQYSQLVLILQSYQKLDTVQVLLILSLMLSIDSTRSHFLLYSIQSTQTAFLKKLRQIISVSNSSTFDHQVELLSCFLPFLKTFPNSIQLAIDLLTDNLDLFKFISQQQSLLTFCLPLEFTLQHLSSLIQSLANKHFCLNYCAQLGLSICLSVELYLSSLAREKSYLQEFRMQFGSSLHTPHLVHQLAREKILKGIDLRLVDSYQRLKILLKTISIISNSNISLYCRIKADQSFQQTLTASFSLCFLLQQQSKQLLSLSLGQACLRQHLPELQSSIKVLMFTVSLLELKNAISQGNFQVIVRVLNRWLSQIAPAFKIIKVEMGFLVGQEQVKELCLQFIQKSVQAISLIVQRKVKIVRDNRYLLHSIALELLWLLRGRPHEEKRDQGAAGTPNSRQAGIELKLQGLINGISNS